MAAGVGQGRVGFVLHPSGNGGFGGAGLQRGGAGELFPLARAAAAAVAAVFIHLLAEVVQQVAGQAVALFGIREHLAQAV